VSVKRSIHQHWAEWRCWQPVAYRESLAKTLWTELMNGVESEEGNLSSLAHGLFSAGVAEPAKRALSDLAIGRCRADHICRKRFR